MVESKVNIQDVEQVWQVTEVPTQTTPALVNKEGEVLDLITSQGRILNLLEHIKKIVG